MKKRTAESFTLVNERLDYFTSCHFDLSQQYQKILIFIYKKSFKMVNAHIPNLCSYSKLGDHYNAAKDKLLETQMISSLPKSQNPKSNRLNERFSS